MWTGGRLSYQQQILSWETICMHYQQWCSQGVKERSLSEDHRPIFLSCLVLGSMKSLGWHSYNSQYYSQQLWVFGCSQMCVITVYDPTCGLKGWSEMVFVTHTDCSSTSSSLRTPIKLLGTCVVWKAWKGLKLGQFSAYQLCKTQKLLRASVTLGRKFIPRAVRHCDKKNLCSSSCNDLRVFKKNPFNY